MSTRLSLVAAISLAAGGLASAQPEHGVTRNEGDMTFASVPMTPGCLEGALEKGDPFKTPFIMLAKADDGCVIPWHRHTADEHLMMVSGTATVAMRDQNQNKPTELRAGGFAMMPGSHVHEFRCTKACTFYLYSDGKFDIHYVDKAGKEIPAAQALEPFKETPTPMPKGT